MELDEKKVLARKIKNRLDTLSSDDVHDTVSMLEVIISECERLISDQFDGTPVEETPVERNSLDSIKSLVKNLLISNPAVTYGGYYHRNEVPTETVLGIYGHRILEKIEEVELNNSEI